MQLAEQLVAPHIFIATAQPSDQEMQDRIGVHRAERDAALWQTLEEAIHPEYHLASIHGTVLLDCLALWVSNLLLAGRTEASMLVQLEQLLEMQTKRQGDLIIVSNEVGSGVVPEYFLGRTYRDWLGRANQRVAKASDYAFLLVAGLPLALK